MGQGTESMSQMTRRNLFTKTRQWLSVGMGVKRWVLVLSVGSGLIGMGLVYLLVLLYRADFIPAFVYDWLMLGFLPLSWRIILPLALGVVIVLLALARLSANIVEPFRRPGDSLVDSLYLHSKRGRGPHIVAIGGGTGLPALLRGLKEYTSNITAVVTVADDGGSSGRLREELGLLPPGDFRNNIAALSQDEALMTQVLQYRFGGDASSNGRKELRGHAFGNLLLAALAGITGSFDEALLAAERVLAMRGRVLPSTLEQVTLVADVVSREQPEQARRVVGESAIPRAGGRIRRVYLDPAGARAYPPAVQAILRADLIVIGPGSLYTSILPNLLVPAIADAVRHSRAPKVYVCNLATQPGETDDYDVTDHVRVVSQYLGAGVLDYVIANDNLNVPPKKAGNTVFVEPKWHATDAESVALIWADLVDNKQPWRHDSEKLARAVRGLVVEEASQPLTRD
jgi:uncharacterized cofD-like protein